MRLFANIPIKRKLTWIIMIVSLTSLAVACLALGIYDRESFRKKLARDISIVAEIIAENSRASLDFDDPDAALQLLASLRAEQDVEQAIIVNAQSEVFATYRADGGTNVVEIPEIVGEGHSFTDNQLIIATDIGGEDESQGKLFILCGLGQLEARMGNYAVIVAGALLAGSFIALLLTGWLQRVVTGPVFHLHDTVQAVASERNYTLRAVKTGEDELGHLIDGFNEMLSQIQSRDAALQRAHNDLESRVEERTAELKQLLEEQKRTQVELETATRKALAASEAKSSFLASMSHEIRTPINGLMGFAKLLDDTKLNRSQREYVDIINSSGEALLAVINDILDFSKLEAGKLAVSIEPFDLRDVTGHVADLLGARAAEKRITLAVSCPDNLPTMAIGDSGRVRQILLNLAGNAVKFTEKGHVLIEITCDEVKKTLLCSIRDTGIGISAEAREHLFQKFVQADATTTRKFGGTGLGLAISKSLVEMMDGEIGVDSVPGEGSSFWFTVPLAPLMVQRNDTEAPEMPAGTKLLVVEPESVNRRVLEEQLKIWNVDHTIVKDTDDAVLKLMDEAGELAGWTAILLPQTLAAKGDAFVSVVSGFAGAGLKILTRTEPGEPSDPHVIDSATVHFILAAPLGRRDRLWSMLGALNSSDAVTGDTYRLEREPDPEPDVSGPAPTKYRVLVAEDNAVNRKLASKFLEILYCDIEFAVDGLEAVDQFVENRFDLIFMDCHMPECDGYEATRRIRMLEQEKKLDRTPIVALTANVMSEGRKECAAAGMDDFVTKPVELEDLQQCLERWCPDESAAGEEETMAA